MTSFKCVPALMMTLCAVTLYPSVSSEDQDFRKPVHPHSGRTFYVFFVFGKVSPRAVKQAFNSFDVKYIFQLPGAREYHIVAERHPGDDEALQNLDLDDPYGNIVINNQVAELIYDWFGSFKEVPTTNSSYILPKFKTGETILILEGHINPGELGGGTDINISFYTSRFENDTYTKEVVWPPFLNFHYLGNIPAQGAFYVQWNPVDVDRVAAKIAKDFLGQSHFPSRVREFIVLASNTE